MLVSIILAVYRILHFKQLISRNKKPTFQKHEDHCVDRCSATTAHRIRPCDESTESKLWRGQSGSTHDRHALYGDGEHDDVSEPSQSSHVAILCEGLEFDGEQTSLVPVHSHDRRSLDRIFH